MGSYLRHISSFIAAGGDLKTHPYLAVVRQDPRRIVELPIPDDLDRESLYELGGLAKDAVLFFLSEDDHDKAAAADRAYMEIDRRFARMQKRGLHGDED